VLDQPNLHIPASPNKYSYTFHSGPSKKHRTSAMSNPPKKANAYGTTTSDTSFRKTWDRAEYAAKAEAREAKVKEEGKARYEAKIAGKKYIPRASTPPDAKEAESRSSRLDVASNVGKTTLVPAGAATGKRGKGAGFYCADCDLTFKDNLQFVDHLNSRQHLVAVGQSGEVRKATLEEVKERLAWLKRKRDEEKSSSIVDLRARLEKQIEDEERAKEEKRRKRRERRRKTEGGVGVKEEEVENNGIIC
jgi:U4/U6.U5 tri-snRNP component SNU23